MHKAMKNPCSERIDTCMHMHNQVMQYLVSDVATSISESSLTSKTGPNIVMHIGLWLICRRYHICMYVAIYECMICIKDCM